MVWGVACLAWRGRRDGVDGHAYGTYPAFYFYRESDRTSPEFSLPQPPATCAGLARAGFDFGLCPCDSANGISTPLRRSFVPRSSLPFRTCPAAVTTSASRDGSRPRLVGHSTLFIPLIKGGAYRRRLDKMRLCERRSTMTNGLCKKSRRASLAPTRSDFIEPDMRKPIDHRYRGRWTNGGSKSTGLNTRHYGRTNPALTASGERRTANRWGWAREERSTRASEQELPSEGGRGLRTER